MKIGEVNTDLLVTADVIQEMGVKDDDLDGFTSCWDCSRSVQPGLLDLHVVFVADAVRYNFDCVLCCTCIAYYRAHRGGEPGTC
jgi:hypothetical protein